MVPPGGNTTFDVVFLARQEGNVENTLYIHTSHGSFTFHVSKKKLYQNMCAYEKIACHGFVDSWHSFKMICYIMIWYLDQLR